MVRAIEGQVCAHHWVIEPPSGPTSAGVCKLCGDRRGFRNSVGDTGWEKGQYHGRRSPAARAAVDHKALTDGPLL